MRIFTSLKLLVVTLFFASGFADLYAQNSIVQGVIVDDYGINIPGAAVMIESLNKGVVSNQDGKFTFLNVPQGNHQIVVKYLGFKDTFTPIDVTAGETLPVSILLTSEETRLDDVQITGFSGGGQARALNTQKNNLNITNVVSTDQIGKFPDANIGDATKRIPGITMQMDQGEARNIIVRGLAPQLNSVTLNGSRIPSAEGDNRNVQMDLIPSDMIQTIEVNKAVTPDMDADALGGSVNLVTRSTPQGFRLSATGGSGVNFINDKRILSGSFLIGDRSKDKKFGWLVSASINDNDFGSDNVEAEWSNTFAYTDAAGEETELDVNPYTSVFETRKYLVQRVRRSFSANMDYNFDENNEIYLKTMYNWRDDRENRFAYSSEILDAEDIEVGDFELTNNTPSQFPVEAKRETKGGIPGGRTQNRRLEDQRMQNYSLGGNHIFGNLKFTWMGSFAKASEERPNERYLVYASEYTVNNTVTNNRKPLHTSVTAEDFTDFELDELTEEYQFTEEKDVNFFANFELPANFFNTENGTLKFGVRGRFKNKNRENNFFEYSPLTGNLDNLSLVNQRVYTGSDFLAGSQYSPGVFASATFLGNLDLNNMADFEGEAVPDEYLGDNFDVTENVFAGYVMTNQKITDKLDVLVGLRVENTRIESTGNSFNVDEPEDVTQVNDESSYTNILPGVHFKYNSSETTVLRFAWTNTIARPNYIDLVPYRQREDDEISIGNPQLNPTTSMNFDFMAERYFESVGILSGGVFYKNLNDFIYTQKTDQEDGIELYQPLNGDKATIFGAEVAFQRQLDFLPGFLKNFGIYANYTYLNSEAKGIANADGDMRGDLDLPGSSPNMFNASLSYGDKWFNARLSSNYADAYIDELGGDAFEDRFYDEQFFLDFNATVFLSKNLQVYANLNNITNQPLRYYQGVKDRTMQMEYYSTRLTFGVKYDLF
ncbi:TonB-dependent receptor [Leeuwenhoekiella aequorea]|uniref:TonB-dependent receptor n=1 Tax=Leeuwenhoekiella aequorea TaxID=283736 RepID=A0A4Q0P6H6_9FLAO|nr:TonB-dependent receptor [Leeuwenhoekiella aequorea]RXG22071.1 TonB-dependent receptor [Leeuwenhoekiella aequorea]